MGDGEGIASYFVVSICGMQRWGVGNSNLLYCQFDFFFCQIPKVNSLKAWDFEVARDDVLVFCFCHDKLPQTW